MLSNNKPWQVNVNADNLPKVISMENNLGAAQQNATTMSQLNTYLNKATIPKRYSFDDNGGGYQGL